MSRSTTCIVAADATSPSTDADMQMTRENKLALVVGFALILFVGILISDHFSTARNQMSADLVEQRPSDPLAESRRNDPNLIDRRGPQRDLPSGYVTSNTTDAAPTLQSDPPTSPRPERKTFRMDPPELVQQDESHTDHPPFLFHDVKQGETLTSISRQYYGDESLAMALAKFNNIDDPSALRVNHRLRIPAAEALGGSSTGTSSPARPSRQTSQPAHQTYTVRAGDSLSDISQRLLGTTKRWREIYELNRDVISDPDNVKVGTVLKIPK